MNATLAEAAKRRIIPVVEISDPAQAVPLAQALSAGGLPVAEITLRTPRAIEAIRNIANAMPEFTLGAGSIVTTDQVASCAAAGAKFVVSPGLTTEVSNATKAQRLPFIPGVATAAEIMVALHLDFELVKFFPAEQMGGVRTVHSLAAPFAATGLRFMPTGGVTDANLSSYLSEPSVAVVGGSWIASRSAIADHDFAGIRSRAAAALALTKTT